MSDRDANHTLAELQEARCRAKEESDEPTPDEDK